MGRREHPVEVVGDWSPLVQVVDTESSAGRRVTAKQDLLPATTLLMEHPALLFPSTTDESIILDRLSSHEHLSEELCSPELPLHADATKAHQQLYANAFAHVGPRGAIDNAKDVPPTKLGEGEEGASKDAALTESGSPSWSVEELIEGIALYRRVSMMNHSCAPSAALVTTFDADRPNPAERCVSRVVTLREIKAGEEVTISYQQSLNTIETRRRQLLARYGFSCQCERCADLDGNRSGENWLTAALPPPADGSDDGGLATRVRRFDKLWARPEFSYALDVGAMNPAAAAEVLAPLLKLVLEVTENEDEHGRKSLGLRFNTLPPTHWKVLALLDIVLRAAKLRLDLPEVGGVPRSVIQALRQVYQGALQRYHLPYLLRHVRTMTADAKLAVSRALQLICPDHAASE